MSDQYEYFDEDGNPIDPSELEGGDYEIVDEQPTVTVSLPPASPSEQAPTAPAADEGLTISKGSKGVIIGALAALLLVGGGATFALSQIGNQNTAEDVKTTVATKKQEAVAGARPDLNACDGSDLKKARWERGGNTPALQLKVIESVPLPSGFANRAAASTDPVAETAILQFGDRSLGIYEKDPKSELGAGLWWKVTATTDPQLAVTGEAEGKGGDVDAATACESVTGGVYRVVGDGIPAKSKEMQADLVQVSALKGDGADPTTVWVVAGDHLLKTTLEYTPDEKG